MSGKDFTERIWVVFVIIFLLVSHCYHPLETLLNNGNQFCRELRCQAGEETVLKRSVFC